MTNNEQTDAVKQHDFAGIFLGVLPATNILNVCVFISSPFHSGITGVQFFPIMLKPVRRVISADANMKRCHQKVLKARRKPTPSLGEF